MSAIISLDNKYRFSLSREWEDVFAFHGERLLFVMCNPSTADADVDDPTIRRCKGFADRLHCRQFEVVNLFAMRATDPRELRKVEPGTAIHPANDDHIRTAIGRASTIICAWGNNGTLWDRDRWVLRLIQIHARGRSIVALKIGKTGQPAHPLYLPANSPIVNFPGDNNPRFPRE